MAKYCFCVNCGARILDTQVSSTCSMCDGDIDHEKDQLEQNRRRIEVDANKIYKMKLGDLISVGHTDYTRVPGGWMVSAVYTDQFACCFVPYSEEFSEPKGY